MWKEAPASSPVASITKPHKNLIIARKTSPASTNPLISLHPKSPIKCLFVDAAFGRGTTLQKRSRCCLIRSSDFPAPWPTGIAKTFPSSSGPRFSNFRNHDRAVAWPAERPDGDLQVMSRCVPTIAGAGVSSDPSIDASRGRRKTKALPFTEASIARQIRGVEKAGRHVVGVKPDGTLIVSDKPLETVSLVPVEAQAETSEQLRKLL